MRSRVSSALGLSLCAAWSVAAMACAHPEAASDRHFAEMREQVTHMQADHDRFDQRLDALEVATADEKALPREAPTGAAGAAGAGPAARVVQLGGPTDGDGPDPNDPSARPDIRVTGAGGGMAARPRSGKTGRARIEESEMPNRLPDGAAPRSSALDPDAKAAYETALGQVQAKQFERGLEGLNGFLARWPDHPYAENATYWRGEALFGQGEYLRAAEQFDAVIARFGSGKKAPDALLKLGMCHDRLGSSQRAREYWDRLKTEFPRSDAAKKIPTGARETSPSSPKGPKENR